MNATPHTTPDHTWHRLTELRPQHMQWIILVYAPKGRRQDGTCEYFTERVFRYEKKQRGDLFRSTTGVDHILSPQHEADAVWCSLPSKPPHLPAWDNDEKWSDD